MVITVFNRREVFNTFDMEKFNRTRVCLEQGKIPYTYRTVSQSGSAGLTPDSRTRFGSAGVDLNKNLEYKIFVRKADYEQAVHLLNVGHQR